MTASPATVAKPVTPAPVAQAAPATVAPAAVAPAAIAPAPAIPPVIPPAPPAAKPIDYQADFNHLAAQGHGTVTRSELKLDPAQSKLLTVGPRQNVSYANFVAYEQKKNSFVQLDTGNKGQVTAGELSKLDIYNHANYAVPANGELTKSQFLTDRSKDITQNRNAGFVQRFEKLTAGDKAKLAKEMHGQALTAASYVGLQYKRAGEAHAKRVEDLFKSLGAKDGVLDLNSKAAKAYAAYDTSHSGKLTLAEFAAGQKADRQHAWDQRILDGSVADKALQERLHVSASGQNLSVAAPASTTIKPSTEIKPSTDRASVYMQQPNGWSCGPTSLTMAMAALHLKPSNTNTWNEMVSLTGAAAGVGVPGGADVIAAAAKKAGADASFNADASPQNIRAALDKGRGVVVNGSLGVGGHFIYVAGVNKDGQFNIFDPYRPDVTHMSDSELNAFANTYSNPRGFAEIWHK